MDANIRHPVGYLSADGVETLERGTGSDVALDVFDDSVKLFEAFRGLRIKIYVAIEVEMTYVFKLFDNDGTALCLPHKPQNLGMTVLTEDHNLRLRLAVELPFDTPLQLQYHRTSGIDDLDTVATGRLISLGRFAVSSQQHLYIVQVFQLFVIDSYKPRACSRSTSIPLCTISPKQ